MDNPFSYSGIVTNQAFCNRANEQKALIDLIKNSENILLYSHRKTGKTSLIQKVFYRINHEFSEIQTIYIDLYGTLSEQDFVDAVFTGITQVEPRYKKILNLIPGLKLVSSVDPATGMPTIAVSAEPAEKKSLLAQAMQALAAYAKKNRLVVALDEFQEIAGYGEAGFEKRLRSHIQHHDRIAYLFSGSQAHLLSEMFNSAKRPFYQSAHSFPLGKIEKSAYVTWAQSLFAKKKTALPRDIMEAIVDICDYHPLYIQQFLYTLWRAKKIDMEKITQIENELLLRHQNEYVNIFDGLTVNQKKALKLVAKTGGKSMFQADALQSAGLKNGSLLSRALQSLQEKELIAKNGRYQIQDVMLRKWLLML